MGATCCRCQHLDDPLLSLSRASASAMSANYNHFYVPAPLAASSSDSSSSSSSSSLANYVAFPFPFVSKPKIGVRNKRNKSKTKSLDKKPHNPHNGPHSRATAPVRSLCAQLLVHHGQDALQAGVLPPEVASNVLQWLKQHYVLDKPQFQALTPFLLLEWNLADQQEVEDSWFDDIPETTMESVKSIDVTGCIHLQQLGSEWGRHVNRLPELLAASFQGCSGLSKESIETLKFSTKLTTLNFSGCVNGMTSA
ncbi:Leucine-rich repeat domain, L domain-like [Phytophthora cactorum]|nr:Leucine-rich repeat domain, L domain-like [Phytophthora cactorum]